MTEYQKEFLKKLLNEPSPSGYEEPVQNIWKGEVSKYCKNITRDIHGNLSAALNPGKEKSVMIVGHSDEVGLIVNYINDNGFIYFSPVGGLDTSILTSHRVRIITKKGIVHGAVGRTSVHLDIVPPLERKVPKIHEIWIDIGAKDKKEAEKYISVGDPVVFGEDFQELVNGNAMARCWDNRVGIYIVAEVLRKLSKAGKLNKTVYGVSSTQEETGLWSARVAAYSLKPTLAIAIDVMPSTDNPDISKEKFGDTKLGKGPVITRGVRTNRRIYEGLITMAKKKRISYQVDVDHGYTSTDADPISTVRGGIPIGVLSIATRYLHSSVETLNLRDIDNAIELLTSYILEDKLEL
jgi:putative aminopeptidase FrvX